MRAISPGLDLDMMTAIDALQRPAFRFKQAAEPLA